MEDTERIENTPLVNKNKYGKFETYVDAPLSDEENLVEFWYCLSQLYEPDDNDV